jgi:hypothetical protein
MSHNISSAPRDDRNLLDVLRFELRFLDAGGYEPSVRQPRLEKEVFLDSPSCINYADPARSRPCTECALLDFVPENKRNEENPCHHIPFDERGDSIANMGGSATKPHVQTTFRGWLVKMIETLETSKQKS